jgi:DNA-binding transcriptional ArsR family regulator
MVRIELGVEDLANTRFGISPLTETVFSLWALTDPSRHTLHLPWVRAIRGQLDPDDARLLGALVGPSRIPPDFRGNPSRPVPDFLTPRPMKFVSRFEDELATVRSTQVQIVRRDLLATHAPMQLVLEADTTYRARQLATGGARRLFADMHPNITWSDGVLSVAEMMDHHTVAAAGRGLLLTPSIFAYKPVPPLDPGEPPSVGYPSRGIGTLWSPPPQPDVAALVDLLGRTRALLLQMLEEPLATVELARRLKVTPSAVSQHLQVLHATGLVVRDRDRRQVLYRRSQTGDRLTTGALTPMQV